MKRSTLKAILVGTVICAQASVWAQDPGESIASPREVFDRRIMPIFNSPKPSSCVQCHLSSVDLTDYILPSHDKTFISLRDQGLIDIQSPAESKILKLIRMGDKDLDEGAKLIHAKTRQAEYDAFASWIRASCNDPVLREMPPLDQDELAGPEKPEEVIRHSRKSRVIDSFVRNVWSQRMRCFPCHTPHEVDPSNPRHQAALKKQNEFKAQYDAAHLARLRIFRETPEATVQYLIERSQAATRDELPLVNLAQPAKSLIVLKPTSKLPRKMDDGKFEDPSSVEPVSHMGGLKMHRNDHSYKAFLAWIQDYAKVVRGEYQSVEDLPADNWFASKHVLRITNVPADWQEGVPIQVFVHAWNPEDRTWSQDPVAFTQGTVTPRRILNGSLFLLSDPSLAPANKWDPENAQLAAGKYLVKTYLDSQGRLSQDPTLLLGEDDYYGETEVPSARWREGFRFAEKINGSRIVARPSE